MDRSCTKCGRLLHNLPNTIPEGVKCECKFCAHTDQKPDQIQRTYGALYAPALSFYPQHAPNHVPRDSE